MPRGYEFLAMKCFNDKTELIRVAESEANDRVYCPTCFAWGDYKRMTEQGAGLIGGVPVDEETRHLIDDLARKRRQEGA